MCESTGTNTRLQIAPITLGDLVANDGRNGSLLALNNAHASELSRFTAAELSDLVEKAFVAWRVGSNAALLIALADTANYAGENFLWFQTRYANFIYVDRIVVDPARRREGMASALYETLFDVARAEGFAGVGCEVNSKPPNPASDAFHKGLGFVQVGSGELKGSSKSVRYFLRPLIKAGNRKVGGEPVSTVGSR